MIKSLARHGAFIFTILPPFAALLAIVDYILGVFILYPQPGLSLSVHLTSLVMTTGLFCLLSLGFGSVFAVILTLVERVLPTARADQDEDDSGSRQTAIALVDWILGPAGSNWKTTTAAMAGALAIYAVCFFVLEPIIVEETRFVGHVAVIFGIAISIVVTASIYRLTVARQVNLAGHRVLLVLGLCGALFYAATEPAWRIAPMLRWPYLLASLFALTCLAIALIGEESSEDTAKTHRVLTYLTVAFLGCSAWTVATYDAKDISHAELHTRTRLYAPVYRLIQGPLDYDGDGQPALLGGSDCREFDDGVGFSLLEAPDNGVDDNCIGGDPTLEEATDLPPDDSSTLPHEASEVALNVFFICIDTLRADYVGREYEGHSLTPNLDAFAESSVTFERAYAPSTHTNESIPSMMSGEYPSNWHQWKLFFGLDTTIAQRLGAENYETAAVLSVPYGRERLVRGFQYIDNELGRPNRTKLPITSPEVTNRAIDYLDRRDDQRPLLMWVHYFDPHGYYVPHEASPDWLGSETKRDFYAHEVYGSDRAVGRFLDHLERRGYMENSVIVFFSDHGEGLGENHLHWHVRSTAEPVIRVPLIVYGPGVEPSRIDTPVSLVDIHPTVTDMLGLDPGEPKVGRTLRPALHGESLESRPVFAEMNEAGIPALWAVIDWPWKLRLDLRHNVYQLHDLDEDPSELRNLISEEPDEFDRMKSHLGQWRDRNYNVPLLEQKRRKLETRPAWKPETILGDFETKQESPK